MIAFTVSIVLPPEKFRLDYVCVRSLGFNHDLVKNVLNESEDLLDDCLYGVHSVTS